MSGMPASTPPHTHPPAEAACCGRCGQSGKPPTPRRPPDLRPGMPAGALAHRFAVGDPAMLTWPAEAGVLLEA